MLNQSKTEIVNSLACVRWIRSIKTESACGTLAAIPPIVMLMTSVFVFEIAIANSARGQISGLEKALQQKEGSAIVSAIHNVGDAERGKSVFFDSKTQCSVCHSVASDDTALRVGPNLADLNGLPHIDDAALVESVLYPNNSIRQGYETVQVVTDAGRIITGRRFLRRSERSSDLPNRGNLTLIESGVAEPVDIPEQEIEEIIISEKSSMPEGLLTAIGNEQAFYDLMAYVIAVRDGQSSPTSDNFVMQDSLVLPEYESRIDHAGLITSFNDEMLEYGQDLYSRRCANCHGNVAEVGSLPTAARFSERPLKNGSDPFSMYRTMTYGFGAMQPQHWMVPKQKYAVIHYIREHFFANHFSNSLTEINGNYLASLPAGDTFGPEPIESFAWSEMDYGNWLSHTIEIDGGLDYRQLDWDRPNIAYKGNAVRIDAGLGGVAAGEEWIVFDQDMLRIAAHWEKSPDSNERFIDWHGIQFDGRHQIHPRTVGDIILQNSVSAGWANPSKLTKDAVSQNSIDPFEDDRLVIGRDGLKYGPLPKEWARYQGLYSTNRGPVFSYSIGDMSVLERFEIKRAHSEWTMRRFSLSPTSMPQMVAVTDVGKQPSTLKNAPDEANAVVTVPGGNSIQFQAIVKTKEGFLKCSFGLINGKLSLSLPPNEQPRELIIRWRVADASQILNEGAEEVGEYFAGLSNEELIANYRIPRFPEVITTPIERKTTLSGFTIETLKTPEQNPWNAIVRPGGLDFSTDGSRLYVATWDGDVFAVEGLDSAEQITWRRIASGLFQPLGVKVIDGKVYVSCRDQIVILEDHNQDGETDFYRCFNNDHQVTEHFHEFAMGLQKSADGSLYYAKSARHALPAVVPHHGTLLKVTPDGKRTEIVATGFRAANGVCINDDGSFYVTDQEGHWTPKNRINRVVPGGYYGNDFAYHDSNSNSDDAMHWPLVWITNEFDRSPGQLLKIPNQTWGNLGGTMLNLSYGYGQIYTVFEQEIGVQQSEGRDGVDRQGAMAKLNLPAFETGIMRGRFDANDQLYCCGLFAWAGNQQSPGGLYRIRYSGQDAVAVIGWKVDGSKIALQLSDALDEESIDCDKMELRIWDLNRSANYGSPHVNEKVLEIDKASLSDDGKTLTILVSGLKPTWGFALEIQASKSYRDIEIEIHGSIYRQ